MRSQSSHQMAFPNALEVTDFRRDLAGNLSALMGVGNDRPKHH
jgi:hypothetical protein